MARRHEDDAPETKEFTLPAPLNIKGVQYQTGDKVQLTAEEYETLEALGVGQEKTPEEIQAAHDEGRAAQDERLKQDEEEAEESDSEEE